MGPDLVHLGTRMDDGMDGWIDGKLLKKQPRRPLLYVIGMGPDLVHLGPR